MTKITKDQFNQLYNQLKENFKGMDNLQRLMRCYNYVSDLPVEAVREIVEDMIDHERFAPLPAEFEKKAASWKSDFYKKNGYYFNQTKGEIILDVIDCAYCLDTGINKITKHHDKAFKQLMRCDCDKGSKCMDFLPAWNGELSAAFIREKLDSAWFNPKISTEKTDIELHGLIWGKAEEWSKIKKRASKYWIELGYKGG